MTLKFLPENFLFEPDEVVPNHVVGKPRIGEGDLKKLTMWQGHVTLATEIEPQDASLLLKARNRFLVETGQQKPDDYIVLVYETERITPDIEQPI